MEAHFVTFLSPGTFFNEETTKPIDSWDIEQACAMAREIKERFSATPFAFVFSTRGRSDADLDSKVTKRSGRYYLGGRVMTLADVRRDMPNGRVLRANMESNKWARVIVNDNSWRVIQPFEANDTVLDWQQEAIT